MSRDLLVDDAVNLLLARGFAPSVERRGRHQKIRWIDQGRRQILVVSRSSSDWRARLNSRATLRRILRNGEGA
jgi:hypothetical protein